MRRHFDGTITFFGGLKQGITARYEPDEFTLTFCENTDEAKPLVFFVRDELSAIQLYNQWAFANGVEEELT